MKKAIKGLIIAASVASVIGVGAVSFAAWEGSGNAPVVITGSTGTINTLGALTVTPADDTYETKDGAIIMNELYPVDQGSSYLTYWEFTLESEVTGEQSVAYSLKAELTLTDGETAELYWIDTAPEPDENGAVTGGTKLTGGTDALTGVENGDTIYVYLVASGTDAMKAGITLTFSATAAAESST